MIPAAQPPAEGNIRGLRFVGTNGALIVRALIGLLTRHFEAFGLWALIGGLIVRALAGL